MSLALSESGPAGRPALPRGALPTVLAAALGLHVALVAVMFWSLPRTGTVGEGQGGLTVGLGPSGAAPGAVAPVAPRPAEAAQRPREAGPDTPAPAARTAQSEAVTVADAVTVPSVAIPEAGPAPSADSVDAQTPPPVTKSVAPLGTQSPEIAPVRQSEPALAARAVREIQAAADAPPETVTSSTPREGLGVSRRPVERPEAVEEAGSAADAARSLSEAEPAAPSRTTASGRQGRGGSSQGTTRGGGDGTGGGGSPGARADFAALVAARLARAKQYPSAAQARSMQGTGVVWFRIDAAGRVTAARLNRSTGHALLDEAIMRTLRRASLPGIPESLGLSRMEFSVPIAFTLR